MHVHFCLAGGLAAPRTPYGGYWLRWLWVRVHPLLVQTGTVAPQVMQRRGATPLFERTFGPIGLEPRDFYGNRTYACRYPEWFSLERRPDEDQTLGGQQRASGLHEGRPTENAGEAGVPELPAHPWAVALDTEKDGDLR